MGEIVPRERVLFYSDGLRLVGELHTPPGEGPWPGVVLCHGLGSRKERHADFAAYIAAKGIAALAFDLRGHGESEGKLDGTAGCDVEAAVSYLAGRPEIDPKRIAVRGSSLGGHLAIHVAARAPQIRAAIAICPAPEQLLAESLRRMTEEGREVPDVRLDLQNLPRRLRESDLRRSVAQIAPRPLLLIHCTGDQLVPYDHSMELYRHANQPKELWLVNGGSHTTAQHDGAIHERTAKWLLRHLTP